MKFKESVYRMNEEALQLIEERLFEKQLFSYAVEENRDGLFLKVYDDRIDTLMKDLGYEPDEVKFVDPTEWAKKQLNKPFEIARGVIVDPTGEYDGSDEVVLKIPPGMAFGTGIHPTTRIAASFLVDYLKPGMSFLDVGTGSGILSILADKMGAKKVIGVDVDEQAVMVARENASLNGSNAIFMVGDLVSGIDEKFDLVVANIVPAVLKELANAVKGVMKTGSLLALSGINEEELDSVIGIYEAKGFEVIETRREEDWAGVMLKLSEDS